MFEIFLCFSWTLIFIYLCVLHLIFYLFVIVISLTVAAPGVAFDSTSRCFARFSIAILSALSCLAALCSFLPLKSPGSGIEFAAKRNRMSIAICRLPSCGSELRVLRITSSLCILSASSFSASILSVFSLFDFVVLGALLRWFSVGRIIGLLFLSSSSSDTSCVWRPSLNAWIAKMVMMCYINIYVIVTWYSRICRPRRHLWRVSLLCYLLRL